MATKVFVGNLSYNTTEDDLKEVFGAYGTLKEVTIIVDRETGRSRGFGFITFEDEKDATKAVDELNRSRLDGRTIGVEFAKDKGRDSDRAPRQRRDDDRRKR